MTRNQPSEPDLPPGPARDLVALFRLLRGRRPLTVGQLAIKSGLAAGHVSEVLRGKKAPGPDAAEAIARALGADAGAALRARHLAEALAELNRYTRAKAREGGGSPFDVPPPPAHFTGRTADADDIRAALDGQQAPHRAPVVLIHGMPGIGKTALACHVAHSVRTRYPDGCLFVDCVATGDMSAAYPRLLKRLGVAAAQIPDELSEARALYLATLYRRSVLIVLDGVTSAADVAALVPASPTCAVIATSRSRLDALDDCHPRRLGPLADHEAAALFRTLAQAPGVLPDADLARIASACGGVPLAIRVAAAKYRHAGLAAADFADLLDRPATAWRQLDDGERSVRQTLADAVGGLPADSQRALAMFALFPARAASAPAIAWLADASLRAVGDDLAVLDRHDLVTLAPDGRAAPSALARAYAASLAGGLDEQTRSAALRRLVVGYTRSAAAASRAMTPPRFQPREASGQAAVGALAFSGACPAMAWYQAEAEVIPRVCALAYDLELDAECWRLAYAMRDYFFTVKALDHWVASHRIALAAAERCRDVWAQAVTRNNLGMALAERRQFRAAHLQHRRALEMLRVLGHERGVATTLGHQAWASHLVGQHDFAISLAQWANALNRRHDNRRSLAIMDRTLALACAGVGRFREALWYLAECQEILSELDLPLDVAMALNCLGEVHYGKGDLGLAADFHARAAEQAASCGSAHEQERAASGLAVIARAAGAAVPAARSLPGAGTEADR